MFAGAFSVLRNTVIGGGLAALSHLLSRAVFGPMSSSVYSLALLPAYAATLSSFLVCSMVIAFLRESQGRGNTLLERRTRRLRHRQLGARTAISLGGMMVAQSLFWLFLPKIVCGRGLDNSPICLGGDSTFVDLVTASLVASLTGFMLGWTVLYWTLIVIGRLQIGTGDDFGDFLIYNEELHKAVREDRSNNNQDT